MSTYRCPACGHEVEVTPRYGTEVVSVYCCRHTMQARDQIDPVRMEVVPVAAPSRTRELAPVG
jgi:hypothetical protein